MKTIIPNSNIHVLTDADADYGSIFFNNGTNKYTVSITVDNVEKSYPSPVTFNILFGLGVVMAIGCVFLSMRMKHLATKMTPLTAKDVA